MISFDQASKIFRKHIPEILCVIRRAPRGSRVFAAVDGSGNWLGTGQITANFVNLITDTAGDEGYVIHFYPETDNTDIAVSLAIEEWREEMRDAEEATQEGRDNDD